MRYENDKAFKEWAVSCDALATGRQTVLIRKGGIREEGGVFRIQEQEFFLLPTYEHQKSKLLQPQYVTRLQELAAGGMDRANVTLSAYAVVDTIVVAKDEEQVAGLAEEHIWNETFVKMRFDFNPYDPLYLVLLRTYRLHDPIMLPVMPDYNGCKSWITLERPISTEGAMPTLGDEAFGTRKEAILSALG